MKSLKQGCGLIAALWVVLVAAYAYVAWPKIHEVMPTALIAVLGGTFAAVLIGAVGGLVTGARDRAAFRRAAAGEPMRDGRLEAASGPIRPSGATLEAPFTGRPCVAYEYDVKAADESRADFFGVGLAPCAIETARGPVRVLGWSTLDQFAASSESEIDLARGTEYLKNATFERVSVLTMVSALGELLADVDGAIHKDFSIAEYVAPLDDRVIEEHVVAPGTVVTMLGRWSDAQRGFVPAGPGSMNRLFAGELKAVRTRVSGTAVKTFATGVGLFLALHAILIPMYLLAPGTDGGAAERHGAARLTVWDERDCDQQQALLAQHADPNERGQDGLTPLMNAARYGLVPCVRNLIAAGARLEDADVRGDTALTQAIMAGRDDVVDVLHAAGARDFRVTEANGRAIDALTPPVASVKQYLAALQRGDVAAMGRVFPTSSTAHLSAGSSELPLWQSSRPAAVELVGGWINDDAATLTVHGRTSDGDRRVSFHVVRDGERWLIVKEWLLE